MFVFDTLNGGDDDLQLIRNINKVCSREMNKHQKGSSSSSGRRTSPSKAILKSFLHELSFWDEPSLTPNDNGRRRHNSRERRDMRRLFVDATTDSNHSDRHSSSKDYSPNNNLPSKPVWKTAVDPTTGRVYYYDTITRVTQWKKPQEVRDMEKMKRREKRKRDLEFFHDMETNIKASLKRGELIPGIPLNKTKDEGPPLEPLPILSKPEAIRIRTISGMDEGLLAELRDDHTTKKQSLATHQQHRVGAAPASTYLVQQPLSSTANKKGRPPLPTISSSVPKRQQPVTSMELSPDDHAAANNKTASTAVVVEPELAGEMILDEPLVAEPLSNLVAPTSTSSSSSSTIKKPACLSNNATTGGHTRRNTGGTIYLQTTMENPDIKATIKCICGIYRTHIIQTVERQSCRSPTSVNMIGTSSLDNYDVFNDDYGMGKKKNTNGSTKVTVDIPSLSDVLDFYAEFFRRSQMEFDTIIVSLIYVERLIKCTNGQLSPGPNNWRSILFACMVLASKVWDDLSMWNVDFSNVSANTAGLSSFFSLARINQLELALLTCLNYDVRVSASEYAKYYFLIRTMLLRSGLVKEANKPLNNKEDAFRRLETKTDQFQAILLNHKRQENRRSKSLDASGIDKLIREHQREEKKPAGPVLQASVCLEQLVSSKS